LYLSGVDQSNSHGEPRPDAITSLDCLSRYHLGLSATDVTALATIALVVAAALAFGANVYLAWKTRSMADATKQAADATRDEANASKATVNEMLHDREWSYRPYISWRLTDVTNNGPKGPVVDNPSPRVVGANFGRGPGSYCLCVAFWPDQEIKARSSLLFDLSPDQAMTKDVVDAVIRTEPRAWAVPGPDVTGPVVAGAQYFRVAFCQDQLGNAYRVVPFRGSDMWRPNTQRPSWLDWYEQRRMELEKI
jgi:hypothetical protein